MIGWLAVLCENFGSGSAVAPFEGGTPSWRVAVHWMSQIPGLESWVKKMMWPLALLRKIFWNRDGARLRGKCFETGMGPACAGVENFLKLGWGRLHRCGKFCETARLRRRGKFFETGRLRRRGNFFETGRLRRRGKFFETARLRRCGKIFETARLRCHGKIFWNRDGAACAAVKNF